MAAFHRIDGVLLLDKPKGLSSNRALQQVRRLFGNVKGGYAGTLDPLASGLLPISLGEATKFISFFSHSRKSYEAIIKLGFSSSTGDAEGELSKASFTAFDSSDLERLVQKFTGDLDQIPPMHSAIKINGKRLYKIAREGRVITREKRPVTIDSLKLSIMEKDVLSLSVTCSKGTYIRVLGEDIARCLGTEGYLTSLRRTGIADIFVSEALPLNNIEDIKLNLRSKLLKNIDFSLPHFPSLSLTATEEKKFMNGIVISMTAKNPQPGVISVYTHDKIFVGLADVDDLCDLRPKRLMSQDYVADVRRLKEVN